MAFTKIAVRNIPRRKLRNLLTAIGIVIGVSLLVGVNIASESSFVEYKNFLLALMGQADIVIASTTGETFDERTKYVAIRGVTDVEATGRLGISAFIMEHAEDEGVRISGVDSRRDFVYVSYRFDGKSVLRATDVTVSKAIRDELEVEIGDNIAVRTTLGKRLRLHVVGVYHPPVETGAYQIFMDLSAAQRIFNYPRRLTAVVVKVEDVGETEDVRKAIERNLGSGFKVSAIKEETIEQTESNLAGWRQGLDIMSTVALFVCLGLVVNTMYMNVGERIYEIGVLRALGARRRKIFWMFFCEALVLGLVGVSVGLGVGVAMARGLYYFISLPLAGLEAKTGTLVLKPEFFILGAAAGLIATMAGGLIPSISAARTGIMKALKPGMRPPGKQRTALILLAIGAPLSAVGYLLNTAPVETYMVDLGLVVIGLVLVTAGVLRTASPLIDIGLSPLTRGAFDAVGKVLSKNLGRNLKRAAVTYATIGISITFLIIIGGLEITVAKSVDDTIRQSFSVDISITPSITPLPTSFAKNLFKVDPARIDAVTFMGFSGTKSGETDIGLIIIDPETFPKVFNKMEFTEDTPKDVYARMRRDLHAIILIEPLADSLEVSVGQRIPVYTHSGTKRLAVVGIVRDPGLAFSMGGGFLMSEAAFVSYRTARTYFLPSDEQPTANLFAVNVKNEAHIDTVKDEIEKRYGETHDLNMFTLNDLLNGIRDQIHQVFVVFDLILYIAVLSASAGIATTMVMNVNERLREIGILRAQGMKRRHILTLIMGEAMFLGIFGFLVGLPSGLILLRGVVLSMSSVGMQATYVVPFDRVWFSLALALIVATVGVAYPSYRAVKMRTVEVLRYRG